jgi:hypothetical protein
MVAYEAPVSSTFEKQYSNLSQVKINEMFRFVSDVTSKVPTNDHMPTRKRKKDLKIRMLTPKI